MIQSKIALVFQCSRVEDMLCSKILASSLLRSLFDGEIIIINNSKFSLFKIERRKILEYPPSICISDNDSILWWSSLVDDNLMSYRWVFFIANPSIAMRNITHLVPSNLYAPEPDIYFFRGYDGKIDPGIWAAQSKHLRIIREHFLDNQREDPSLSFEQIWNRTLISIPLRKKLFEHGEIYSPTMEELSWRQLDNAAFVTLSNWPEEYALNFLQTMYLGKYIGDKDGLIVNMIDS